MSLAAPLALLLLALAVPVLAAFLARRRAPKAVVGSVILLRAAVASARARQFAPRLREPVALALTLLALAALAGAVAGPSCGTGPGGRLVIVVDPAASMGHRASAGGTALAEAVASVAATVEALPAGAEVVVLRAGNPPQPLVGRTTDHRAVVRALRSLQAAGPPAELGPSRDLVDALCRNPERDQVVWVLSGPPPPGGRCPERAVGLSTVGDNVGIADLVARRADGLGLLEVLTGIVGDVPREVDLAVRVDGRLVDTARVDVSPERVTWDLRRFDVDGELITVELLDLADANPLDDRAEVRIDRRAPLAVGLVTERPSSFVATGLRLHPAVAVQVVAPSDAGRLSAVDLVVLESPARLPAGVPAITFGPEAAQAIGLPLREVQPSPQVIRWAFEDPRLAFVDLDGVQFARAAPLPVPPGGTSLIDADIGPLLVAGTVDEREVVAFGFAARDTDLVLRTSFLHLLANLIEAVGHPPASGAIADAPGARGVLRPSVDSSGSLPSSAVAGPVGISWVGWLLLLGLVALLGETAWSAVGGWVAWRRSP